MLNVCIDLRITIFITHIVMVVSGDMEDEIEYIKRKKMVEYMRRILESQAKAVEEGKEEDIYEKVRSIFTTDGYNYLLKIKKTNQDLADNILRNLLLLIMNGLTSIPVDKLTVEVLERKLSGYRGKIYVEKKGELKEFSDILKDED